MLPDLRVLLLATVTTFLLATGVGLYASVRLLPDPIAAVHPDRDTPISRVALSWQDMNRAPVREVVPAVIERSVPLVTLPQAEDNPASAAALGVATDAAKEQNGAAQVATKVETPAALPEPVKDDPTTTGAIAETPSAPALDAPPRFAARPEPMEDATPAVKKPIEAVLPVAKKRIAAPVKPHRVKKILAEPRKLHRPRIARQPASQWNDAGQAQAPMPNFFEDPRARL